MITTDIMDIDKKMKKGKKRNYIKHSKLRVFEHKNHVNKNVPERSTGSDCKRRLHCKEASIKYVRSKITDFGLLPLCVH